MSNYNTDIMTRYMVHSVEWEKDYSDYCIHPHAFFVSQRDAQLYIIKNANDHMNPSFCFRLQDTFTGKFLNAWDGIRSTDLAA